MESAIGRVVLDLALAKRVLTSPSSQLGLDILNGFPPLSVGGDATPKDRDLLPMKWMT